MNTHRSVTLPGTDNETGAFAIQVTGDTLPERDESFRVDVTTTSEDVGVLFTETQGTGTITDTDIGVAVSGSELLILGTAADDVIRISTGDFRYSVELNGETVVVSQAGLTSAFVRTFGGDDDIDLTNLLVPAFVQGDIGRDTIKTGSRGMDSLVGGAGNDRLIGGYGDDRLDGGSGNDSMEGSRGNDVLLGRVGDDTLSGGIDDDTLIVSSLAA